MCGGCCLAFPSEQHQLDWCGEPATYVQRGACPRRAVHGCLPSLRARAAGPRRGARWLVPNRNFGCGANVRSPWPCLAPAAAHDASRGAVARRRPRTSLRRSPPAAAAADVSLARPCPFGPPRWDTGAVDENNCCVRCGLIVGVTRLCAGPPAQRGLAQTWRCSRCCFTRTRWRTTRDGCRRTRGWFWCFRPVSCRWARRSVALAPLGNGPAAIAIFPLFGQQSVGCSSPRSGWLLEARLPDALHLASASVT